MNTTKNLVSLVALVALAVFSIASVSAFGDITSVEVNGVEALGSASDIAVFAGETLSVRVVFNSDTLDEVQDVRLKAGIVGGRDYEAVSERFVVDPNKRYVKTMSVQVPFDLELDDEVDLVITVESKNEGIADSKVIALGSQRESYIVEVLDVDLESKVKAGDTLPVDVVLKNRGREEAEDTFVSASIPALGISDKGYFGDLSAEDRADPDKEDSAERRLFLRIPSNAPAGVYVVEVEAYNSDSVTTLSKKIVVVGSGDDSRIVAVSNSKTFAVGEEATYSLTIVNTGSNVAVYDLVLEVPNSDLNVDAEETLLAIPAGTSRTVKFVANSNRDGKYAFSVNVHSDGSLVKRETFTANVEGTSKRSTGTTGNNTTVLLTVILAIIFVVLLVVLIVLLTRKPEKSEEFGESYY